ncbi:IS200/IS605 family element transposase accessory protein TnpB [Mannheimia haemolytica]
MAKLKDKIGKLHHKIANCRKDFLHKISTQISKNHAMIYVEDLQVANMSKSAKGTAEVHGKNVKQKSGLNRVILDQSWFEFRRQLDYKTQWLGGFLLAVPPQNTSRTCPCCNYTAKENRQTQENFECVECGYTENADVVGSNECSYTWASNSPSIINIRVGHTRSVYEVNLNRDQQ